MLSNAVKCEVYMAHCWLPHLPVELVEAAPGPRLGQPREELAQHLVVETLGAVEHHTLLTHCLEAGAKTNVRSWHDASPFFLKFAFLLDLFQRLSQAIISNHRH